MVGREGELTKFILRLRVLFEKNFVLVFNFVAGRLHFWNLWVYENG